MPAIIKMSGLERELIRFYDNKVIIFTEFLDGMWGENDINGKWVELVTITLIASKKGSN